MTKRVSREDRPENRPPASDVVVEMDAMDVAEWEHGQRTPQASDANLAALVKKSVNGPESAPIAVPRRSGTVTRAPSSPAIGPLPRPPTNPPFGTLPIPASASSASSPSSSSTGTAPRIRTEIPLKDLPPAKRSGARGAVSVPAAIPSLGGRRAATEPTVANRPVIQRADASSDDAGASSAIPSMRPQVVTPTRPMSAAGLAAVQDSKPERPPFISSEDEMLTAHRLRGPDGLASIARGSTQSPTHPSDAPSTRDVTKSLRVPTALRPAPLPPNVRAESSSTLAAMVLEPVGVPLPLPAPLEPAQSADPWAPSPLTSSLPTLPQTIGRAGTHDRAPTGDPGELTAGPRRQMRWVLVGMGAVAVGTLAFFIARSVPRDPVPALTDHASSAPVRGAAAARIAVPPAAEPVPEAEPQLAPSPDLAAPLPGVHDAVATPEAAAKPDEIAKAAPAHPAARPVRRAPAPKRVIVEYTGNPSESAAPGLVAQSAEDPAVTRARSAYVIGNQKLFAGDVEGALTAYRQTLELYPGYVGGYRGLGLAYAQRGDRQKALDAFRTYVAAVPTAKDVDLIKKRIARLQGK